MKKLLFVVLMVSMLFAGGGEVLITKNGADGSGHRAYALLPNCGPNSADTVGPINLSHAKFFSTSLKLGGLTGGDSAIIDSGITINVRLSATRLKADMVTPTTVDSALSFKGSATINTATGSALKSMTLDPMKYIWYIFTRTDTNVDTLAFTDSTTAILNTFYEDN